MLVAEQLFQTWYEEPVLRGEEIEKRGFGDMEVGWLYNGLVNKNSSGDEIANVNFFTTISHTYFKTPKREPISFNKLDYS